MANKKVVSAFNYVPSERQTLLHTSPAFETLYGGAAGGGKTAGMVVEAAKLGMKYPGIRVYYFRRTYPELEQSVVPEFMKLCQPLMDAGEIKYNSNDHTFYFQNGSTVKLAYCDNPTDRYKYLSAEFHVLIVDELTTFEEDIYEFLKTRVRSSNPNFPLKVLCATNPGGIGHSWVKRRFIHPMRPETLWTHPESGETRMFIPATVEDNPIAHLRDTYRQRLQGVENEEMKRAYLYGDWNVFEGQMFTEWRSYKEITKEDETKEIVAWHVVPPFTVPDHWVKWMAVDWGYNTKAAALWLTKDPTTNRTYIYRELYVTRTSGSKLAETILAFEGDEQIRIRLADPSMWKQVANYETGEILPKIMADATQNRVILNPATNNREAGVNAWHEALATAPDGRPWLQVFESCVNTVRTIPDLPRDEDKPEDVDTDAEDHLYDCGRYALLHQQRPKKTKVKRERRYSPSGRPLD